MQPPIGYRARIVPALKNGSNGPPNLFHRVLGKRRLGLAVNDFQIAFNDRLPVICLQISVTRQRLFQFVIIQHFLEKILRHAHNHIAIHLDKAAIAVPCKTGISGMGGQRGHGFIVKAKVQHCVHHAGH